MPKFIAHVTIVATDANQAAADLFAMSQAHTNKSVRVEWIETIGEKKMTEGIIPSDVLSYVKELWFKSYDDAKCWKEFAECETFKCETEPQKALKALFMLLSDTNANFAIAYRMIKNTIEAVNIIIDSFFEKLEEKSANKDEVLSLRKELTSKVIETLAPINEEIRKRKERDEQANNTEHTISFD